MADSSHAAKTLVIKAEDARILCDIKSMRAAYAQLYSLNASLLSKQMHYDWGLRAIGSVQMSHVKHLTWQRCFPPSAVRISPFRGLSHRVHRSTYRSS